MTSMERVQLSEIQEVWESFSGWYWYVTEYHEGTLVFGLVLGWEIEWGYFDLAELRELERESKVWRVPKKVWAFCPGVDEGAPSYSRVSETEQCQQKALPLMLPGREQMKGGNSKMEDEINNKETATLCFTKAGRGVKVVVDGNWFYASKASFMDLVGGKTRACTFHTIRDEEVANP